MIPTTEDLQSDTLTHRLSDMFNPPGLTNFVGCVQTETDVTAIRSLSFPPLGQADTPTGGLFVDGRYFPSLGVPVTFRWTPDRVERAARLEDLDLRSTTFLVAGRTAAVVLLEVRNLGGSARTVDLRLGMRSAVTNDPGPWQEVLPPHGDDNVVAPDRGRGALTFVDRRTQAACVQGTVPAPDGLDHNGATFTLDLSSGERRRIAFVCALGPSLAEAAELYDHVARDPAGERARAQRAWDEELEAVFTPHNERYSGWLPTLETTDAEILRLYHTGVLGVVMFKRESPGSAVGRAYDTLMPAYWQSVTFLWDYHLSSLVHALLDPGVMRAYLEHWMSTDVHTHFGTERQTGAPVGEWYAVNDYAMTRTMHEYLRWTGDYEWLTHDVMQRTGEPKRVIAYLEEYATNWERFLTPSGLADYGAIGNLLECVSTYVHEVASLNAANVWSLRAVSEMAELLGDDEKAGGFAYLASILSKEVMSLYANGKGWWHARGPDGELVPVRHAYDFVTILNTVAGDLTETQKSEMTQFFQRELWAPTWMHALSCSDPDAMFSVRPDHQWTGAYTAWPAQAVCGLYRIGRDEIAFDWLKGLARTANQGPFGQAHFAGSIAPLESGGALKAPPTLPFICDWACSSGGAWVNVVLEGIFGVEASLRDGISAAPRFGRFDPDARLRNLRHQDRVYDVDRSGLHPA